MKDLAVVLGIALLGVVAWRASGSIVIGILLPLMVATILILLEGPR